MSSLAKKDPGNRPLPEANKTPAKAEIRERYHELNTEYENEFGGLTEQDRIKLEVLGWVLGLNDYPHE